VKFSQNPFLRKPQRRSQAGRLGQNSRASYRLLLPLRPCSPRRHRRMPPVKGRVVDNGGRLSSSSAIGPCWSVFLIAWRGLRPEFHGGPGRRGSFCRDGHGGGTLDFYGDLGDPYGRDGDREPSLRGSMWLSPSSPRGAGGGGAVEISSLLLGSRQATGDGMGACRSA
jgi:hypothetical protein